MKKMVKKVEKRDEVAEDWCFECYEGGLLIVCDYKHCLKSYHADCVGKDESFFETGDPWLCRRHCCFECKKSSKYLCFGCPNAVCESCINDINFARIRGNKGLCNNCLKLALLGEEGINVDSDGECVDFEDLETFEGLFLDYWKKVVKEKESLTLEDLQSADIQMKKGAKYKAGYKLKVSDNEEEFQSASSSDGDDDDEVDNVAESRPKLKLKRKRYNQQKRPKSGSTIPKSKRDIVSWGSNCLLDFLESLGEDTSRRYEPYKIASIISRYADENKLIHPEKTRKIICDEKLKCLLGRKIVEKNKLIDLLEPHFPEYLESSGEEEEEIKCSPKKKDKKTTVSCNKNQRNKIIYKKDEEKVGPVQAKPSCFAFIVPENIKLVFLKRSLIQELSKKPETFAEKVVGSFVRVKIEAGPRKYFFQLLQVTGIKKTSTEENDLEILLQVATMTKDIAINLLSDDNFSEEECEDLRKKAKDGLVRRPAVVELEQKARSLHEDIIKHWIAKELAMIQNRIDHANEKGRRREYFECLERQRLLRTPEEQSRLLKKVPNVIPDLADDDPVAKNSIEDHPKREPISQKLICIERLESPDSNKDIISSDESEAAKPEHKENPITKKDVPHYRINDLLHTEKKDGAIATKTEENHNHSSETYLLEALSREPYYVASQVEDNIIFNCEYFT